MSNTGVFAPPMGWCLHPIWGGGAEKKNFRYANLSALPLSYTLPTFQILEISLPPSSLKLNGSNLKQSWKFWLQKFDLYMTASAADSLLFLFISLEMKRCKYTTHLRLHPTQSERNLTSSSKIIVNHVATSLFGRSLVFFAWNIAQHGAAAIDQHEIKSPFIGE